MTRTKRIMLSLALVGAVAAAVGLGSAALFSDTETSTDNVLQAGSIDLKLDNTSYYFDGKVHKRDNMSWTLKDLEPGVDKFFDLTDLKPGDWGEDTISLHVTSNPAWVCANIDLTGNDENTIVDPEATAGDTSEQVGELGNYLNFVFWADDGDNVWECTDNGGEVADNPNFVEFEDGLFCERPLLSGVPSSLEEVSTTFPIADASGDAVWPNPLDPQNDYYIGKYWCFGKMGYDPAAYVAGDDKSPLDGQSGFTCDGGPIGWANDAQTDGLTADITFTAVQQRHNEQFVCNADNAESRHVSLENKRAEVWSIISDDQIYGDIEYSHNDTTFHGVVTGTGLVANGKYQITLNGPGGCTLTDDGFAGMSPNAFSSGYWNDGSNLEPTCGTPGEGVYNMDLIGDHYTFIADGDGAFTHNFNINLPAGDYSGVKVLVKKMLDNHEYPWADTTGNYPEFNLYETASINFTVL